jgi:hypothetical protein
VVGRGVFLIDRWIAWTVAFLLVGNRIRSKTGTTQCDGQHQVKAKDGTEKKISEMTTAGNAREDAE